MTVEIETSEQRSTTSNGRESNIDVWAQIKSEPPEDFEESFAREIEFIRDYLEAQSRIIEGEMSEAGQILARLDGIVEFREFEEINQPLFSAIDIAVTGTTMRVDELGDPVTPSFKNIKKP